MRLLVVSHYYSEHYGGLQIVAGELARHMARRGADVVWVASGPTNASGPEGVVRRPVPAWNVAEDRLGFPYPLWGPKGLLQLRDAVARCDVLHLHDSLYIGSVAAYLWARRLSKPVVVTQHIGTVPYSNPVLRGMLGLANRTLARLVLRGCDRVVFCSLKAQAYFSGLFPFPRPPAFIENGLDKEIFRPAAEEERRQLRLRLGWPEGRPVFLFVGRFVEKKGLGLLRELVGQLTGCEWVFVGWGEENPARWRLPNLRCAGALPPKEVARCYQAADLLVLPSVGEGFPLVVQEAMACGLPAMVTPDTATGVRGLEQILFRVNPQRDAWRDALSEVLAEPARLQARRGLAATCAGRRWGWDVCADQYERLFTEVVSPRRHDLLAGATNAFTAPLPKEEIARRAAVIFPSAATPPAAGPSPPPSPSTAASPWPCATPPCRA